MRNIFTGRSVEIFFVLEVGFRYLAFYALNINNYNHYSIRVVEGQLVLALVFIRI